MKTSNKILLSAFTLVAITGIIFILIARANVSDELRQYSTESNEIEKELVDSHQHHSFNLGHNNVYILDKNYTGIKVTGPENSVNALRISDKDPLSFYYEGGNISAKKRLTIRIGIMDKTGISLAVNGNAKCMSDTDYLDIQSLQAGGNGSVNLNIKTEGLSVSGNGNARINSETIATSVTANLNGNAKLYFDTKTQITNLTIGLHGNTKIDGGQVQSVSGNIAGNSKLELDTVKNQGGISTSGNGRDRSNYTE